MPEIITANNESTYKSAAGLFSEYATWLNIDLSFQNFDKELESLKEIYAPPKGAIYLLQEGNNFIGSIAFRPLNEQTAELKRMYVQPAFRNFGFAALLLQKAEHGAKDAGYNCIKLDTLSSMIPAMNFYRKNGYTEAAPYYYNPNSNVVYFEKVLT